MSDEEFAQLMFGKPYKDRCCHVDAVDCWGLVVLYYRLCRGINIHHDDSYDNGGSFATCFNGEVAFWQDTQSPEIGDVVVAYRGNTPVHIAMIWGRDRILHAREKTAVRFDRLRTLEKISTKLRFLTYASNSCSEATGNTKGDGNRPDWDKPVEVAK
nr:MAG: protein of unknown function DUF1287 [Bacteriophage sp.]